eukprot:m.27712 g.27712  ORF g.27712 m.27712 type:complete len:217 (-) comp15794_c0_seq1:531-1181(-)
MNKIQAPSADGGADRTTFVGVIIPRSIKYLPRNLEKISQPIFTELLGVVTDALEGKELPEDCILKHLSKELTEEILSNTFAGLHQLLGLALRLPSGVIKKSVFSADLQFLGLANNFANSIVSIVYGPRSVNIQKSNIENGIKLPGLQQFRWRVDVSISTSELKRAMKPAVLMQMTLTDGKMHTFEMPVEEFHKLRYNTAFVLKEMDDLMKRGVMQA